MSSRVRVRGSLHLAFVALRWITQVAARGAVVQINFHSFRAQCEIGDIWGRRVLVPSSRRASDFIVTIPRRARENEMNWAPIYSSPALEVLEKRSDSHVAPLRWGIDEGEQQKLLMLARTAIERFVRDRETVVRAEFGDLPPRFLLEARLDVTVWIGGEMRGSRFAHGPLAQGVIDAALRACRDPRYKPVAAGELPDMRVEIVVFSPLEVPLTRSEHSTGRVYPEKGYVFRSGAREGWYLPEVHTALRLPTLTQLLDSLITRKARVRPHSATGSVHMFDVIDWIESPDRTTALRLVGPIPARPEDEDGLAWCTEAAEWLCRIQEEDGHMPAVIDASTGRSARTKPADWLRLAAVGHALAIFGAYVDNDAYMDAARRIYAYISRFDFGTHLSHRAEYPLMLAYMVKLARALDEQETCSTLVHRLDQALSKRRHSVLAAAHIAAALQESHEEAVRNRGRAMQEELVRRFQSERASFNAVEWAEAAALIWQTDQGSAHTIMDAIAASDMPSEKRRFESPYAYTRGAAKLLEVFSLDPRRYHAHIETLSRWLRTMQYTKSSAYFVSKDVVPRLLGGFRHDWSNTDAWIDTAGHCLIAAARLFQHSRAQNSND
ncbi:MAG TPA: AMMECR1 domain-containing protein [Candidatus Paceibacterota bacterium]|nr:AMMECR1 domain-containing protein [Candidatus Paceibacterota bacterium]